MGKRHKPGYLPVNQKELASYLKVSPALLSMTKTGRHGSRKLTSSSSKKMAELFLAHSESKKATAKSISLRKTETRFSKDPANFDEKILMDAEYAQALSVILKERLDNLIRKEKESLEWLNTVDQLLAGIGKTRETVRDRKWLENQQIIILKKLEKNGRLFRAKLEIQIETNKIKARVYKDLHKKLTEEQ